MYVCACAHVCVDLCVCVCVCVRVCVRTRANTSATLTRKSPMYSHQSSYLVDASAHYVCWRETQRGPARRRYSQAADQHQLYAQRDVATTEPLVSIAQKGAPVQEKGRWESQEVEVVQRFSEREVHRFAEPAEHTRTRTCTQAQTDRRIHTHKQIQMH